MDLVAVGTSWWFDATGVSSMSSMLNKSRAQLGDPPEPMGAIGADRRTTSLTIGRGTW
jgi:hypothetical protein